VSVAAFIASQRTEHDVPDALACRALDVSESWFYKWQDRSPTARQRRRALYRAKMNQSSRLTSQNVPKSCSAAFSC
jgi:putative transposase